MSVEPDTTVKSKDGVTYTLFVKEGIAGYMAVFDDGRKNEYVYLVPSSESDDGVPTVFAYHGTEGDPCIDGAEIHFVMGDAT